jgi:voltage-gated sodium channel
VEKSKTSSKRYTTIIVSSAQSIVTSDIFDWIVTGVILLQAFVLAIEATPALLSANKDDELLEAGTFSLIQSLVVTVFIVEAVLRLISAYPKPHRYFRDPWNCFDLQS